MRKILSWLLVLTFIFAVVIPVSASTLSSNDINQELGVTNTSSDSSSVQSSVYSSVYDSVYNDEQLAAHDYIFYYVDCGDQTPSTPDPGDKIGLYQSVTDKEYGVDTTGYSWGYGPETDVNGSAADKYSSVRFYWGNTHNADTSVSYRFQLPIAGYYFVTIATKNPWGTRDTNIYLEGVNKSGDFTIPQNTTVEVTYRVYVDDGELNVDIKGPSTGPYSQYNDPMVGFIAVEGVIPISYLQSQISTLNTEINKKKEDGSNYYTVHSINEANTAIYEAQTFIDNFNPQVDDIASENVQLKLREELNKIKNAFADLVPDIPNTVFKPGQIMRDTNGAVIDAHGGYIMYDKITKKYYWYGEYHEGKWPSSGVRCYSSTDLLNWKDEGMALTMIESMDQFENDPLISELYKGRTDTDSIFDDIRVGRIIERPRVIYNDKTKKYVMWMHVEGSTNPDGTLNQSYAKAQAGVAVSDSPTGPFEYLHSYRMDQCPPDQTDYYSQSKGMARDLTLFKDDDGSAYLIYSSEENYTIYISKLTPDYTDITGWHKDGLVDENGNPIRDKSYKAVYGMDYVRVFPGEHREAPAMFKYDGKYYLLTSGATGWAPNENEYAVADNIFGPWSTLVNPFVKTRDTDPDPMKAFNSQTTCVIPVDPQKGKFIYVGDMWNNGDFSNDGAKYVFLPIEFGQGSDMIIRWYDSWDPSILDSMGKVNIETKFPEAVALGTLPTLPATVDILDKGTTISTPAIWTVNSHTPTVADFSTPGQVTLELKLPDYNNKVVYVKMYVIPDKTIYFVNCGGYVTSDYSLLTSYMQNTLINKGVADQAYNPDDQSPWGYIGNDTLPSGSDSGDIWSTVRYLNGGNISNSPKGTDLSYQFTLENGSYDVYIGFNDPWTNLSRKANLVINGEVKGPITFTPQNVQVQKGIEVTNNSLNITVRNTAAQDPLISWIMIVDNDLVPSSDPTMGLIGSSPSPTTVNLTWHKILGATGYTLYRSDSENGMYEPIYSGNAGTFTDSDLQQNRTYYYKVSYTNDTGEESPLSTPISVITKSDVPTSATAQDVADKITAIPAPAKGATRLTLPTVPDGFSIAIKSSDNPAIIGTDGVINPLSTDTIVHLVLEVTRISDGSKATTTSIAVLVPGKATRTTHTGGSSGNGSTINNNGSTMNDYGTISITDNTTTLTLDVSKTLAAINNTQGSQVAVDLTSIGTTKEKVTKIPKEVINAAKDSGKDIVIKSDNTQLVLSKDFIDLNNVGNSITVSIKDKGKTNVANYIPLSNTLDISIKSDNGNIAINKPVEVTLNISNVNDPRKAAVYYYNNTTGKWEYVGGKVNKADNTITFSATHFSQYAAFEYDKTFNDIKNHWAKDDIEVLASKHIVEGVDANNFAPDKTITRAEFAAMMIRLLRIPEETYKGEFSDVKTGDWYANAIEAAYKAGIILGDGSNMRPNDKITREEMASIAMRVYGKLAAYNEEQLDKTMFNDDNIISDWAKNAVANAVKQGIINGEPNNMFAPKGNATRAEAAAVIYNLLDKSNNI